MSNCKQSCLVPGIGLRLVTRECLTSPICHGLKHSVQLCQDRSSSSFNCKKLSTPEEYASNICSGLQSDRLSGLGRPLENISRDPDRACKVSCQDVSMPYRFYVVSSSDGRMPSGTPCGGLNERAFCVMGKCLEFGPDQTPLQYEMSGKTLSDIENVIKKPRSMRRLLQKRSLFIDPPTRVGVDQSCLRHIVRQINATH